KAHLLHQGEEIIHNIVRRVMGLPVNHEFSSNSARATDEIVSMTGGFVLFVLGLPILLATALANLFLAPEAKINNNLVNALATIRQLPSSFQQMGHQVAVTTNGVLMQVGLKPKEVVDPIRSQLLASESA